MLHSQAAWREVTSSGHTPPGFIREKKWRLVGNGAAHMQHGSGPPHSQCRPLRADMNKICHPHYIRPKRPAPTETAGWIAVIEIQWPQQKHSVCWSGRKGRGAERRKGGNYSQSILSSSSSSFHFTTFSAAPRARKHRGRRLRCRPSRAKEPVCRCSVTQRCIAMLLLNPTTHTHTHAYTGTHIHTLR